MLSSCAWIHQNSNFFILFLSYKNITSLPFQDSKNFNLLPLTPFLGTTLKFLLKSFLKCWKLPKKNLNSNWINTTASNKEKTHGTWQSLTHFWVKEKSSIFKLLKMILLNFLNSKKLKKTALMKMNGNNIVNKSVG